MVKEQGRRDVTMDQMMVLDVPQDVQDGRLKRVVLEEHQQLLMFVLIVELRVRYLLGLYQQYLLQIPLSRLNKKNKNVNLFVEMEE